MSLTETLQLLLITYNRKEALQNMLSCIFAGDSPVKGCSLIILDNCSTDGTTEMLAEYAKAYPNIQHLRHPSNIGGNANYVHAIENIRQDKTYFWVLCDDDLLHWDSWNAVGAALLGGQYDLLQVYKSSPLDPAAAFAELTFIPGAICRSSLVTGDVINSMYMHLNTMFPQLVLAASVFNAGGRVYSHPIDIVDNGGEDTKEYTRGIAQEGGISNILSQTDWLSGLLTATAMLDDKKFRHRVAQSTIKRVYPRHEEFYYKYAPHFFDGYYWQFIGPVWALLPLWDKLIFPWMMLLCRSRAGWWMAKGWRIFRACLFNPAERSRYWEKIKNRGSR